MRQSDLANYVAHRKTILTLFRNALGLQKNSRYNTEEYVHKFIMPMKATSEQVGLGQANLWIIDERLAFHNYLASDKPICSMPITDSDSRLEPDILALNVYDTPLAVTEGKTPPYAAITVIEFKRPMRMDSDELNPLEQALGYLDKIRKGQVKTASGRLIPASDDIPGYCYIIADLTPKLINSCNFADLKLTADGLGYFGYNKNYKAVIEVISFDQLLNRATERNRAFFDKLGLAND